MNSFDSPWGMTLETFSGRNEQRGRTGRIGCPDRSEEADSDDCSDSGRFSRGMIRYLGQPRNRPSVFVVQASAC